MIEAAGEDVLLRWPGADRGLAVMVAIDEGAHRAVDRPLQGRTRCLSLLTFLWGTFLHYPPDGVDFALRAVHEGIRIAELRSSNCRTTDYGTASCSGCGSRSMTITAE